MLIKNRVGVESELNTSPNVIGRVESELSHRNYKRNSGNRKANCDKI